MDRQRDTQKDTQTAAANIHFASANVTTDTTLSLFLLLLKVIAVCDIAWALHISVGASCVIGGMEETCVGSPWFHRQILRTVHLSLNAREIEDQLATSAAGTDAIQKASCYHR